MALPIREAYAESVRQVRITRVRDCLTTDGSKMVDVVLEIKHNNPDQSIDRCWSIHNVTPAEMQFLLDLDHSWEDRKVRLAALTDKSNSQVSMCITHIQIGEVWLVPDEADATYQDRY